MAMRIYRQELLNILYDVCSERGVPLTRLLLDSNFVNITDMMGYVALPVLKSYVCAPMALLEAAQPRNVGAGNEGRE